MQTKRLILESLMKKIFFAIPCGDFYIIQNKIIDDICKEHKVNKIVIEEKSKTDGIFPLITNTDLEAAQVLRIYKSVIS